MKNRCTNTHGFTMLEVLISLMLAGILSVAAFSFYITEHNNMLSQMSISDMQQNLRASVAEISSRTINAGANLPLDMAPIEASGTVPDTLTIRLTKMGGSVEVGDHTQKTQASPIHITKGTDLSAFSAGQTGFLWHAATQQGEWFTITKVATNNGSGWEEIHHQGQVLLFDPMPGDFVMMLEEYQYYINAADTAHPVLMRKLNNSAPQVFADNISVFDVSFLLSTLDTVQTVTSNDTVKVLRVSLAGHTNERDMERERLGKDGLRYDTLSTEVMLRNAGQ